MIEKLKRDGMVAVLVSPGFGAGWSSWADAKEREYLCFSRDLVEAVLAGQPGKAASLASASIGAGFYAGGARDLVVEWVPEGRQFEIDEYDGSESIHLIGDHSYLTA